MEKRKWYKVSVEETFNQDYMVLAEDHGEAEELIDLLVNNDVISPSDDPSAEYDRRVDAYEDVEPARGTVYFDGDTAKRRRWTTPRKNGERKRK